MMFTYQSRLRLDEAQDEILRAYAALHGRVERDLFAHLEAGGRASHLKPSMMARDGITARQYNAVAIGVRGKTASIKERRRGLIKEFQSRIAKARQVAKKLEKQEPGSARLHEKKRRLANLVARLRAMQADHEQGVVRLCFGSRKLFRAQFHLEANGYQSLEEWRQEWREARSSQFLVIGSKDEHGGCQGCVATVKEDGSLSLRLRLPDALGVKHLKLEGVRFAYGQERILASLSAGVAISYRFKRDHKSWRVLASTTTTTSRQISDRQLGAIGVDINSDHLAVAGVDRFGNLVEIRHVECLTDGKASEQTKAQAGEAAKVIAEMAVKQGKPVVIERLDFSRKKAEMEGIEKRAARHLSSFAYSQVSKMIHSACFKRGVEVIEINPAFTSVIGAVNHAQKLGISIHQGAAVAIARRGMGLSESPAVRMATVPMRNGDHVTLSLPARNRGKHVWSFWSATKTRLKAARKAQDRSRAASLAPLPPKKQALSATRSLPAEPRHVNRWHNGSANVMEDLLL
jgi:IS605 OrfB family transposase